MHEMTWYVGLDPYAWLLQGNSDQKLMLSPKRDLQKHVRFTLELSF